MSIDIGDLTAYLDGEFLPLTEAKISILDRSFRWGDAVYDVARTFHGKPDRLREHMDRLYASMRYTRMDPGLSQPEFEAINVELVERNASLLGPNDDYHVIQVVSRGAGILDPRISPGKTTIACWCEPLDFPTFAGWYITGAKIITPATRRTPPQALSPKGKISNKMNAMVALHEAQAADKNAIPLQLDMEGNITETQGHNFLFAKNGVVHIPNRRNVLQGIGMKAALEFCSALGIETVEGDFTPFDVYQSDEAFLTQTSACVVPVHSVNGIVIGSGQLGPIAKQLLAAWSEQVGYDVLEQALSHFTPDERQKLEAVATQ